MGIEHHHHGRTHRLDWMDPTLREWDCSVLDSDPELGIVLDRSAFFTADDTRNGIDQPAGRR